MSNTKSNADFGIEMLQIILSLLLIIVSCVGEAQAESTEYFPMIPIYKKSGPSQTLIGVEVPREYLRLPNFNSHIRAGAYSATREVRLAAAQLRRLGLYTYFVGLRLFGTVQPYSRTDYSRTFSVSLAKSSDETLTLGEDVSYGIEIDWSMTGSADLRDRKGFTFADPISAILKKGSVMVEGNSAFDVATHVVRYGLFWNRLFSRTGHEPEWPEKKFQQLQVIAKKDLPVTSSFQNAAPPLSEVGPLTRKKISNLQGENLQREEKWRRDLGPMNAQAPLWNQTDLQSFIQNLCDDLAIVHQLPQQIWPSCRVFGTLVPNASSYPGGDIFVTPGLIANTPNVDTLIFYVAHEMAHVISRHATLKLESADRQTSFYNTVGLLTSVFSAIGIQGARSALGAMGLEKVSPFFLEQASLHMLTDFGMDPESEADQIGLEMALRMGAKKEKIIEGLRVLQQSIYETYAKPTADKVRVVSMGYASLESRIQDLDKFPALSEASAIDLPAKYANQLRQWSDQISPFFTYYQLTLKSQAFSPL